MHCNYCMFCLFVCFLTSWCTQTIPLLFITFLTCSKWSCFSARPLSHLQKLALREGAGVVECLVPAWLYRSTEKKSTKQKFLKQEEQKVNKANSPTDQLNHTTNTKQGITQIYNNTNINLDQKNKNKQNKTEQELNKNGLHVSAIAHPCTVPHVAHIFMPYLYGLLSKRPLKCSSTVIFVPLQMSGKRCTHFPPASLTAASFSCQWWPGLIVLWLSKQPVWKLCCNPLWEQPTGVGG